MRRMTKIDEKKGLEGKTRKFTAPRENPNEGPTTRCHAILSFCSDCPSLTVSVSITSWAAVE